MKGRVYLIYSIVLMFMFVTGCSEKSPSGEGEMVKNETSNSSLQENTLSEQGVDGNAQEDTAKEVKAFPRMTNIQEKIEGFQKASPQSIETFEAFFPNIKDLEWVYEGEGFTSHRMRIVQTSDRDDGKVSDFVGVTKSNQKGDNYYYLQRTITNEDGVRVKITNGENYHPSFVKDMVYLRGPIVKNTAWEQMVKIPALNQEVLLKAVITDVAEVNQKKEVKVRYAAQLDGDSTRYFREERHFREGEGLVFYAYIDTQGKISAYESVSVANFR